LKRLRNWQKRDFGKVILTVGRIAILLGVNNLSLVVGRLARTVGGSFVILAMGWMITASNAQEVTTAQGVYTEAQAARGLELFLDNCAYCHGPEMDGDGFFIPAIGGLDFRNYWRGRTAEDIFQFVNEFMPFDQPGALEAQIYVDVIAYIMQFSGYPAGENELPLDREGLSQVKIVGLP
jgi:mono/diheme cytochrome c family protein